MSEAKKVRRAQEAVRRFVKNVPDSKERPNADPGGDADVKYGDGAHAIEIKRATKGGQVYQVRAIRFIPCVILNPRHDDWYVLPAGRIVREMADHARGMHTQVSFECRQLTLSKDFKRRFRDWRCEDVGLADLVQRALTEDAGAKSLSTLMEQLREVLTRLQDDFRTKVKSA